MVDFLCYLYTMSLYIYIYIQSGKLLADFLFDVRGGEEKPQCSMTDRLSIFQHTVRIYQHGGYVPSEKWGRSCFNSSNRLQRCNKK